MILLLTSTAAAEGFPINKPEAWLLRDTILYVDIIDKTERIYWEGTGSVQVTSPSGAIPPTTLSSNQDMVAPEEGTWTVQLTDNQHNGFDLSVWSTSSGVTQSETGRVFSDHWYIDLDGGSLYTYLYVPVPIPRDANKYVVYFIDFENLAGGEVQVMANQLGGSDVPGWSIPGSGSSPTSQLRIYLNEPQALSRDDSSQPEPPALEVATDSAHCDAVIPGYNKAEVSITSSIDGATLFVCDLNNDGLNYSGGEDFVRYASAYSTTDTFDFDGLDELGEPLPPGKFTCSAKLMASPMHFLIDGVSTAYPGFGIFLASEYSPPVERPMQWNDTLLLEALGGADALFESAGSAATYSPGEGLWSNNLYEIDVTSRGWGDFSTTSRGDIGWVNTWTYAEISEASSVQISVLSVEDEDADSLLTGVEDCLLGTSPTSNDSDKDSLGDKDEVGTDIYNPPDTDDDGTIDAMDDDDDDDGVLTIQEVSDTNATGVGNDVDGNGVNNWHDTDADSDGIKDGDEIADGDGDGIPGYLDPDDNGEPTASTDTGDTGEADVVDTGAPPAPLLGSYLGGVCRCSSAPFSAVLWPLIIGLIGFRRRSP